MLVNLCSLIIYYRNRERHCIAMQSVGPAYKIQFSKNIYQTKRKIQFDKIPHINSCSYGEDKQNK